MNAINTKTLKDKEYLFKEKKGDMIMKKGGTFVINYCDLCNGKLEDAKDIIIRNGKSFVMNVRKCKECGHSYSNLDELERVRKEIYPSILQRIKNFFSTYNIEHLNIFKGKVL